MPLQPLRRRPVRPFQASVPSGRRECTFVLYPGCESAPATAPSSQQQQHGMAGSSSSSRQATSNKEAGHPDRAKQRRHGCRLSACTWPRSQSGILLSRGISDNMQIFLLQAASQLDRAGCLFMAEGCSASYDFPAFCCFLAGCCVCEWIYFSLRYRIGYGCTVAAF
jgi:hypothetical protein